ncbi:MAG: DedA family protein [Verrucomicrobiaceae bacterium]|nr:MAG: DedA family protein [Verrucomicrobiaceae bacterium]
MSETGSIGGMRLVLWFLGLAILVLGSWMIWGGGWESHFSFEGSVRWLEEAGPWGWLAGILLLTSDLVLPVPGTVVVSALGYVYGILLGGTVATVGLMVAGLAGYGVGRLCGERVARRWLGDADFEKGMRLFQSGGGWIVALSRSLPILPEVISCTAGLVRMPFRRFILALACGSTPMGFLFAAIGNSGRDAPGWAIALSVVVPGFLWLAAAKIHR